MLLGARPTVGLSSSRAWMRAKPGQEARRERPEQENELRQGLEAERTKTHRPATLARGRHAGKSATAEGEHGCEASGPDECSRRTMG